MMARNLSPPTFTEAEGTFSVDYRSHSGVIVLGDGDWTFQTHWTTAGTGSIHTYNDGGVQVAVAPRVDSIEQVTEDIFAAADFTSRARSPRVGEIVLLQNRSGYAAAIEIQEVTVSNDSDPDGTLLRARYSILTDKSHDWSNGQRDPGGRQIAQAAQEALRALREVPTAPPTENPTNVPGIGHNRPPQDFMLTDEERRQIGDALAELTENARRPTRELIKQVETTLSQAVATLHERIAEPMRLAREGFYRDMGASLAAVTRWAGIAAAIWLLSRLELVRHLIASAAP